MRGWSSPGALSGSGALIASLVLGALLLAALFFREGRAAVEVWNASTAYGHCYLVVPMAAYLIWDRRARVSLAMAAPDGSWAVLALPITAIWLVSERLGIMEGRQLAAIAGFETLFLVVLGFRLFRALSGPLLFLVFLVPFGAFLTPSLQRFTADFSVLGLDLLGIPHFADNFVIETPAGVFFVAEACAGLRFLIAAVAFGVFYALLSFRSPGRRLAFIAASIAVPIVANGFRALGIVVLGQVLGSAEAAVADHIIYGWLFFSVVMLLLILAGHPFRQDLLPVAAPVPSGVRPGWSPVAGAIATVALIAAGPAIAASIDVRIVAFKLASAPIFGLPASCSPQETAPSAASAIQRLTLRCGGSDFEVAVRAFPVRSTSAAMNVSRRGITDELVAENVSVADAGGPWRIVQTTDPNRATAVASWVDGQPLTSGVTGRLEQARDSLFGAAFAPVLVTITTVEPARASTEERQSKLNQLRAIVGAQAGLDEQIRRLSRVTP